MGEAGEQLYKWECQRCAWRWEAWNMVWKGKIQESRCPDCGWAGVCVGKISEGDEK